MSSILSLVTIPHMMVAIMLGREPITALLVVMTHHCTIDIYLKTGYFMVL